MRSAVETVYILAPYEEKFLPGAALGSVSAKFAFCAPYSFVAEEDGNLVGFILVSVGKWARGKQAVIEEIVVAPQVHRRGCGRSLVVRAEEYLKSVGAVSVLLWAKKDVPAHVFHEQNGFSDLVDWVVMGKDL